MKQRVSSVDDSDRNLTIGNQFERRAASHAARLAIRTTSQEVSYGDLNRRVNRIAHALVQRPVTGPESVATLLGSDVTQVSAFLGTLKVGRRFVPIDPNFPPERARFVLKDAQAPVLLTDDRHFQIAKQISTAGIELVNLNESDSSLSEENPAEDFPLDTHTWIVYTSGTTGDPKGVLQNHRNLMHYIRLYAEGLQMSPEDRVTTLFSFHVNGALHDILLTLLTGATLCPWDAKKAGFSGLARWLLSQGTTMYSSVPTAYRQFIATLTGDEQFPSLRMVRLWGEPSYRRDFTAFQKHFPDHCVLVNRIGASETGPVSWQFFRKDSVFEGNSLPVGYCTAGHNVVLANEEGQETPQDQAGEIIVRSRFLSPGYWRRDEQTRAVFREDTADPDVRLYHTGDMARMLPDGCLVPMGRKDNQVKIRGYRIEAEEIERVLVSIDGIEDAVVVALRDQPDEARLVGYFVTRPATAPTVSAIRRALASRLPEYMIPAAFVRLDAFPLAPNGKIARRALPPPGGMRPRLEAAYAPAVTAEQQRLVSLWKEVLRLDEVGIDDPFLELGGDSLLAAQIVARVLRDFAVDMPLDTLLEAASVRSMAATLIAARNDTADMDNLLSEIKPCLRSMRS